MTDHVHDAMWVTPETFEQQIRWMTQVGDVVSHERILDYERPNDRPLFTVTFDDGWKDNYTAAFPTLKRYKVPALIFLATGAIDSGQLFWPADVVTKTQHAVRSDGAAKVMKALEALCPEGLHIDAENAPAAQAETLVEALKLVSEANRNRRIGEYFDCLGADRAPLQGYIMNWDEVREMHAAGIAFGSHTHNHKILKELSEPQIEEELVLSRDTLVRELAAPADTFAYPNARYHGTEAGVLARCGYRLGFRLHNKSLRADTDPYFIPRLISYESIARNPAFFKLRLLDTPMYKAS